MPDLRLANSVFTPPLSAGVQTNASGRSTRVDDDSESFSDIFQREISQNEGVKFSKHAQSRLESRNITLGQEDLTRLSQAVDQASQKGIEDSLMIMGNLAFIVSVPQKTVVTAMPVNEAGGNVFTNIDGAVIL